MAEKDIESEMGEAMTVHFTNHLSELERLGRIVDEFGRRNHLEPEVVFDMNLALDEILTNIISYGYDDAREHQIIARLSLGQGKWTAEVEDDGKRFNPLEAPPPDTTQSVGERPVGGLGIHLVRRLMDELEYRRDHEKNLLIIKKNVKGS